MDIANILSNESFDEYALNEYKEHCKKEKRQESMYDAKLWMKAFKKGAVTGITVLGNELEKEDDFLDGE